MPNDGRRALRLSVLSHYALRTTRYAMTNDHSRIDSCSLLPGTPGRRAGDEGLRALGSPIDPRYCTLFAPHPPTPSPRSTGARRRQYSGGGLTGDARGPGEQDRTNEKQKDQERSLLVFSLFLFRMFRSADYQVYSAPMVKPCKTMLASLLMVAVRAEPGRNVDGGVAFKFSAANATPSTQIT